MRGRIALTPSNLRLELVGQPSFITKVRITLREENGKLYGWVRHDPASRYNFHQKPRSNVWNIALPREMFPLLKRNWGITSFIGEWDFGSGAVFQFAIAVSDLAPVKGGEKPIRASITDRSTAAHSRDRLNRLVEKNFIALRLVNGLLEVDFR